MYQSPSLFPTRDRFPPSNDKVKHRPAQYLQAPAKWLQHLDATYRNIVGRNILRAFVHPVATCCDILGVEIELASMPWRKIFARTWPNDYNIMQNPQMWREKFDHLHIWANNTQHVARRRNRVAKRAQHVAPDNVSIWSIKVPFLSLTCIFWQDVAVGFSTDEGLRVCRNFLLKYTSQWQKTALLSIMSSPDYIYSIFKQCCNMMRWNVAIVWPGLKGFSKCV